MCLELCDYERLKISVLAKIAVEFEDIKENDVLSVYMSKDKKYIDVHVSTDTAADVIDSVKSNRYGKTILIDAIEYFVPNTAKGADAKIGQSVKMYLDTKGEVAFIEIDSSSYTPAYLIAAAESDNLFDNVLKFRVLTKQDGVKELECDKSIKVDGKTYKDFAKVKTYFMPEGEFASQFVMLRVSSQDKIKMIDTVIDNPETEDDDVLSVSVARQDSVTFRNGRLGHKVALDSNTVVFSIPTDYMNAEDKEFAVVSTLTDWKAYSNVETYKVQERVGYEQFVVVHGHDASMYWESDVPVLVTSFCQVFGDDEEIYEGIIGYQGNSEREFTVAKGVSIQDKGISEGDVIRLKMNPDGTIDDCELLCDYDKVIDPNLSDKEKAVIGGFTSQISFSVGFVTDLVDFVIKGHVPSTGPLIYEECMKSYKRAYEFVKDRFEGDILPVEYWSWMLFPNYKGFFGENSNSARFIADYKVFGHYETDVFHDAWRIFGKDAGKENLPTNTSLQRKFVEYIGPGKTYGYGKGIFLFDGENIIK